MAKKILISFKENDDEMKLYTLVKSHTDRSAYTKEAIEFYEKHRNKVYTSMSLGIGRQEKKADEAL